MGFTCIFSLAETVIILKDPKSKYRLNGNMPIGAKTILMNAEKPVLRTKDRSAFRGRKEAAVAKELENAKIKRVRM